MAAAKDPRSDRPGTTDSVMVAAESSSLVRLSSLMAETLPDAENAVVPHDKIRGYILNPDHADGANKLRVFQAALDIGPGTESEYLAVATP